MLRSLALVSLIATLAVVMVSGERGASFSSPADAATATERPSISMRSIVVRAGSAPALDAVERLVRAHGGYGVVARNDELLALAIDLPDGVTLGRAIVALKLIPGVLYAEPAFHLYKADVPADPLYVRQATYLSKVNAPQAWDIETGRPEVIVAVLDTGIDLSHPDLAGRVWQNPSETPNNAADDDGNGCVDDVNGCAFVSQPSPGCQRASGGFVHDDVGHGTFVAGIVAANGNSEGMVGVARGATVMAVRVLDCDGAGTSMAVAQGILYAAKNGAKVINVSLGWTNDSSIIREAVRTATNTYGALIVAASGNSGKEGVAYPAKYPEVLAVGAASIANPDKRASFSATGPEVDVVAIGERIIGTVPRTSCQTFLPCISGQPYAAGNGTSFSTPQVSGLAALILSRRPGTPPGQLLAAIKDTATAVPDGDRPNWAGEGRINMLEALSPQFRLGVPGTAKN